ncbi:DUF2787 family protein [Photobacterium damselae]
MKMFFNVDRMLLPVSKVLLNKLYELVVQHGLNKDTKAIIIRFVDSQYDIDNDGTQPIEIKMVEIYGLWRFVYMEEFSYQEELYFELHKETEFDFRRNRASFLLMDYMVLSDEVVQDFYPKWEATLLNRLKEGAYDQISVTLK